MLNDRAKGEAEERLMQKHQLAEKVTTQLQQAKHQLEAATAQLAEKGKN